jgi:hypothetical protein
MAVVGLNIEINDPSALAPYLPACSPKPRIAESGDLSGRFRAIRRVTIGATSPDAHNTRGPSGPILAAPVRFRSIPTLSLLSQRTICPVSFNNNMDGNT